VEGIVQFNIIIMSAESSEQLEAEGTEDEVCASCGTAAVDDVKLKKCACNLVKYCSVDCQKSDRPKHKRACRKKLAEIHDKELFEQPDGTHEGDCPICFLPLPLDMKKSSFHSCCCKSMCDGCVYADYLSNGGNRCPFCREPNVSGEEQHNKRVMERVKANDPAALYQMSSRRHREGNYDKAVEYLRKAAELGHSEAHYTLGTIYVKGQFVDKDEEKAIYHYEKAAIGGHPKARHNLAIIEGKNGNFERAVKHLIIAANLGYEESMKALWNVFSCGNITKEELDVTLRGHQAAIDATKSAQRDAAEAYYRRASASQP